MYVPMGKMISAAGTGYRIYKWWKARREKAVRQQRRRQIARDLGLTALTLLFAVAALVMLGRVGH